MTYMLRSDVLTSSGLEENKMTAYEEQIAEYLPKSNVHKNSKSLPDLLSVYQSFVMRP